MVPALPGLGGAVRRALRVFPVRLIGGWPARARPNPSLLLRTPVTVTVLRPRSLSAPSPSPSPSPSRWSWSWSSTMASLSTSSSAVDAAAVREAEALLLRECIPSVERAMARLVPRLEADTALVAKQRGRSMEPRPTCFHVVCRIVELNQQLTPVLFPTEPARRIVIAGAPGSGRTSLARWAVLLFRLLPKEHRRFKTVWVVDGATMDTAQASLARVAAALGLPGDGADAAKQVQDALDSPEHAGWALLVENLGDDVALADQLWDWLPVRGGCIVATTTNAAWSRTLVGAHGGPVHRIFLEPASAADAGKLIGSAIDARLAQPQQQQEAVDRVNAALGGQLLALAQAAALVKRSKMAWADYLAALPTAPSSEPHAAVQATLGMAVRGALQDAEACAVVLQLLQLLHPRNIPRWLLTELCREVAPTVTARELAQALTVLEAACLVLYSDCAGAAADEAKANAGTGLVGSAAAAAAPVSIHPAVQAGLAAFIPCQPSTVARVCMVLDALSRSNHANDHIHMRETMAHYTHLAAWLERHLPDSLLHADALRVIASVRGFFFNEPTEACALYERALAIERAIHAPAPSHYRLVILASNLASCYASTPRPDSTRLLAYIDLALGYTNALLRPAAGAANAAATDARSAATTSTVLDGSINFWPPQEMQEPLRQSLAYLTNLRRHVVLQLAHDASTALAELIDRS